MEVHHHPDLHHNKKKGKEYFLEFLMIFLAVCMGFIAENVREHFTEEKIATAEQLKRVACPVGIKIRSQSVPEIAVSIMAQFIDKRAELLEAQRAAPAGKIQLV